MLSRRTTLAGLLLVATLDCGCGPTKDTGATPSSPVAPPGPSGSGTGAKPASAGRPDKPDFRTTAEEISKEAYADMKATDAKYKGKWVELTGPVSAANKTFSRTGFMLQGGKKSETSAIGYLIVVEGPPADAAKMWGLAEGQKVKVLARGVGFNSAGARFEQATVTELEPANLLRVKAEDLAAEFAKDGEAAEKKYLGEKSSKELLVSGTVADLTKERGFQFVILAGSGQTQVNCTFDEQDWKTLKKGDKVTVKGNLSSFDSTKHNTITVNTAFLVSKD